MPFRPTLARQRHRLRWPARLARRRTANPVAQPVEPCSASFTPPPASMFCRQATAATTSAKPSRTARRGQIPIATRTAGCPTHRDFVPWRFSDAGRQSEGIVMSRPASENLHIIGHAGQHGRITLMSCLPGRYSVAAGSAQPKAPKTHDFVTCCREYWDQGGDRQRGQVPPSLCPARVRW